MVSALLIAGIVSVLVGLLAIAYGASVLAFSLGNPLIVAGATAVCTGMLLVGLWVVVGELRIIARRLAPGSSAETRGRALLPSPGAAPPRSAEGGFLFSRDESALQGAEGLETAAPPVSPQAWQDDAVPRERPRLPPLPEPALESAPPRPGRDRLFSTSRKERDRSPPRAVEPLGSEPGGGGVTEAASASFENAWPRPERAREPAPPRRSGRAPSRFTDMVSEDRSAATIIKSGVVDGMAYSLYSDGSIEAQMPEGMMRFGTIEELRAHLDQH
jgi:hypothetical protein